MKYFRSAQVCACGKLCDQIKDAFDSMYRRDIGFFLDGWSARELAI